MNRWQVVPFGGRGEYAALDVVSRRRDATIFGSEERCKALCTLLNADQIEPIEVPMESADEGGLL